MNRRILIHSVLDGSAVKYTLRDEFTADVAAGSVNGTAAEPGPGTRTVTDTENKLSISSGALAFAGGKASPAQSDPGMVYADVTRSAGALVGWKARLPATNTDMKLGLSSASANPLRPAFAFTSTATIRVDGNGATGPVSGAGYSSATDYIAVAALRAAGHYAFIQGGGYKDFTLINSHAADTTTPLTPRISNYNSAMTCDWIRIPRNQTYLPTPIASDGFGGTWGSTDGLGHGETSGLGAGGSGKSWTTRQGTWGITSGKAQASAVDGTSGRAIATIDAEDQDVLITCTLTRSAGEIGIITRYYDADNWVAIVHDGTNLIWRTRLGGTETDASAAATFGAGLLQVWIKASDWVLMWNNIKSGATRSGVNKSINDPVNANHYGIFTSNTGNTVDNFTVVAVGTNGEHNRLATIFGVTRSTYIVFDGNSLTSGTTPLASTYPAQCLAALGNSYSGINYGVYGATIDDLLLTETARLTKFYDGMRPKNVVVIWEGTNSLPNADEAHVYAHIVTYVQAAQALGYRVVVPTCLPSTTLNSTAELRARRAAFNALITGGAATYGYTVADVAANATIGEDGDETNVTYYVDGVHMTQAGYGVVAGIVATAIQAA